LDPSLWSHSLAKALRSWPHHQSGVDTLTGEGLADAVEGADVLVDVTDSPSFEADAVMAFFANSTANLLEAELGADASRHVALWIVGTERLSEVGTSAARLPKRISSKTQPFRTPLSVRLSSVSS